MKKVFWENPYQHILETKVKQVNGNVVVIEETIGFSESGGQPLLTVRCLLEIAITESKRSAKILYGICYN